MGEVAPTLSSVAPGDWDKAQVNRDFCVSLELRF